MSDTMKTEMGFTSFIPMRNVHNILQTRLTFQEKKGNTTTYLQHILITAES